MHLHAVRLFPERYPDRTRYPFNQRLFQTTRSLTFASPVTMFIGENGAGKSTLLRALCRKCGIHIWRNDDVTRCTRNPYEDRLHEYLEVEWGAGTVPGAFFGSDVFQHFAESLDAWAAADPGLLKHFGGQSLMTQSHGQSLLSYFRARYRVKGLFLLDEPETALSPGSQVALLRLLVELSRAGHAQFILATHSPILMACPGADLLHFGDSAIAPIAYESTEHYRVYRAFLENRDIFLRDLVP